MVLGELWRFARGEAAQSMVETALLLPILVFILIGGADVARAFAVQLAVQNGARAGAEATALDATPTTGEAQAFAVQEMNRTPGMDATVANITMLEHRPGGVLPCLTPPPTIADPCYVTVRVQYTFRTITPWPLIPNTFNLDRSTTMRRFS